MAVSKENLDFYEFCKEPNVIYQNKFVSKSKYSEEIAKYLLVNTHLFSEIQEITRKTSYKTKDHRNLGTDGKEGSEKVLAKKLFVNSRDNGISYPILGKFIDVQTPLKNIELDKSGEIDLLAYNEETQHLFMIEFKRPDNKEPLLRAVLEIATYYKTINKAKLLQDFNKPTDTKIIRAILVFKDGKQYKDYRSGKYPYVLALMKKLEIILFVIDENDSENFTIRVI